MSLENLNFHGDPSLPSFKFTFERPEMLKKLIEGGMTDEEAEAEVSRKEAEITNKQAQARFRKENKRAA